MNDTIKSVVSVASLPHPIHHLQIDLIEGGVIYFFLIRFLHHCGAATHFSGFFLLSSHVRTYASTFLISRTRVCHILFSARDNFIPHPYKNINININNVCIARRPGLEGRAGIFFLFFLFFFKTCE